MQHSYKTIQPGTKIFAEQQRKDRIMLSAGTMQARYDAETTQAKYIIVPRNEWRLPTPAERKALNFGWNDAPTIQQITVVKLPNTLIQLIEKAAIATAQTREEVFAIADSSYWNTTCLPPLEAYLRQWIAADDTLIIHPFFVGAPNLQTVTQDKNDAYTGLHLDSWEAADTLADRAHSRNRICINLGQEPRYFLVFNLNLEQCFKHSEHRHDTDFAALKRNEYTYLWEFLYDYPDYPITRIKVEPYEAYIAPTEYMIHDGSTAGNHCLDIHLTFRANFVYRPSFFQKINQLFG
jgi:cephalosporin hydroxylase